MICFTAPNLLKIYIIGAKWVQFFELNALLLWRSIDAHLQIRISNLYGGSGPGWMALEIDWRWYSI
jgi:hypothetical protein